MLLCTLALSPAFPSHELSFSGIQAYSGDIVEPGLHFPHALLSTAHKSTLTRHQVPKLLYSALELCWRLHQPQAQSVSDAHLPGFIAGQGPLQALVGISTWSCCRNCIACYHHLQDGQVCLPGTTSIAQSAKGLADLPCRALTSTTCAWSWLPSSRACLSLTAPKLICSSSLWLSSLAAATCAGAGHDPEARYMHTTSIQ